MSDGYDSIEAVCVAYAINKRRKRYIKKINFWVHLLNLKRLQEGQFQINYMTLRAHDKEFFKYYRMSIHINVIGFTVTLSWFDVAELLD